MTAPDAPTAEPEVVIERRDHVLIARLNRPEARNALNAAVVRGLGAAVLTAEGDAEIRALVLTGTGDRAFCAGMDLRAFTNDGFATDGAKDEIAAFQRLMRGDVSRPLVGAANATALAGGFELLLACDIIVLAENAKLGLPEVKRGLLAVGAAPAIGSRIPLSIALELALTGDPLDAPRALALGLANAVVPADQVLDVAIGFAERMAANAPLALAAAKQVVRLSANDADAARDALKEWQPRVFGSADAKEGASAFIEKRTPRWTGQ